MRHHRGPPLGEAALLVATVFGLALAAGVIGGPSARIPVVQLLAVGGPVLVYALIHPAPAKTLLGLGAPRPQAIVGATFAGVGVLLLNLSVLLPASFAIFGEPASAPPALDGSLAWQLVGIALIPAVCEELVFRGVLFRSLLRHSVPLAVLGSSAVFALFHFSALRLLPTFAVGAVSAVVAWRSRSTWVAVVCHLANNAALLLMLHGGANLEVLPPVGWCAIAILLVGLGYWLSRLRGHQ